MLLYSLKSRTPVLIGMKDGSEIKAEFIENNNEKNFYVYSAALAANIDNYMNRPIVVTIFFGEGFHKANCRILGKGRKAGRHETVALEVIDEFEFVPQRNSPRIDITIAVDIYRAAKNGRDRENLVCAGLSHDLSREGISVASDYEIVSGKGSVFIVSFYFASYTFNIPAQIMRNKRDVASYEYGFLFDFTGMPEVQDKLDSAIFKEKIRYI